jgi:chemotaxis protein MotB
VSDDDEHEGGGSERWLVSYADFMTLLFAFFTVLYATSEKNSEKTEQFQESVKRYLIKAGGGGGAGSGAGQINQGQLNNSVLEPPIKTYREGKGESVQAIEKAETFVEGLTEAERKTYVADLGTDEWGVRLVLPARVIFAANDDHFRAEALPFLKKLAGLLAKSGRKIMIEGHVAVARSICCASCKRPRASARSVW